MDKWLMISADDTGTTSALKLPNGMIIRHREESGVAMVFIPMDTKLVDAWIRDEKT